MNAIVVSPRFRAVSRPIATLADCPLVDIPKATSPGAPRPSIILENTVL